MRQFFITLMLILIPNCLIYSMHSEKLIEKELVFDGLNRSYYIHLPKNFDKKNSYPVVFVLHGGGRADGDELAEYTDFNEIADREGFIVVYPNGVEAQWNDGRGETFRKSDNKEIDDVGFVSTLIDRIINDYNGDSTRIYVTGLSNGGMMTLRLGCELSSKLAAIAPVIANIPKNIIGKCKPESLLPVLLMNGTDDPIVPWEGGNITIFFKKVGVVVSTEETIQFWVEHNQCDPIPITKSLPDKAPDDGSKVKVITYKNEKNNCEVILYMIEGGGHCFPGSNIPERRFTGRKNNDINGAEIIWGFFKEHQRINKN